MGVVVRYLRDGDMFENKIRKGSHGGDGGDTWWIENTGEFEATGRVLIPFHGHKRNFKFVI